MFKRRAERKSVWIIRFSKKVQYENGKWSTVVAKSGDRDEVEMFANQIAKRHDAEVEVIT